MDIESFSDAFDRALYAVSERKFATLRAGMERMEWSNNVFNSLEALGGLQQSRPPKYDDPWNAFLYLNWYQPGQIQLAHLLIGAQKQMRSQKGWLSPLSEDIHVIDFGCGALALQFAVAWSVAEAIEIGEPLSSVIVDSIDPNPEMIRLGKGLWEQFKDEIDSTPSLLSLKEAIEMLDDRYSVPNGPLNLDQSSAEFWISAIHTTYPSNVEEVNKGLSNLYRAAKPEIGFLTGHSHSGQAELLQQATPFEYPLYNRYFPRLDFKTVALPKVTEWRRWLGSQMVVGHPFLKGDVTWKCASPIGWLYLKSV